MASAARINVLQEDRGLASCFAASNILPDWSTAFIRAHKIETLEDYVYLVPHETWEKSLQTLVDAVPELKSESGLQAVRQASAPSQKSSSESLDEVLPETTFQTVSKDFKAKYCMDIDAALEPSDGLRSRVYREFRKQTMTIIEARRIKSILEQSGPRLQESVSLAGGVKLEFDQDSPVDINSSVQYYWALRTLAYAWAWAGNFRTTDPDGKERLFISLSEAIIYADDALRFTVEFGGGSLLWMSRNDLKTRGKMASSIRRGWSAGQALREALHQCHLEWRSPVLQPTPDHRSPCRHKACQTGQV